MKINRHTRLSTTKRIRKLTLFWQSLAFVGVTALVVSFVAIAQKPDTAYAAPFSPACEPHGYLFHYTGATNTAPTNVETVDLITNDTSNVATINSRTVNAVGYNTQDDYMYGWDNLAQPATTLVRINSDWSIDQLTVTNRPTTANLNIVPAGDVDPNNNYWYAHINPTSNAQEWGRITIDSAGGTYTYETGGTMLTAGMPASATEVLDWAYVNPTFANGNRGGLYTIVMDGNVSQLYRFNIADINNPTWELIGSLTNMDNSDPNIANKDGQVGALYADAYGVLYAGSNNGKLWRVIIGDGGPIAAGAYMVNTGTAITGNDGARCANAYLPVDFGDAPSSYDTRWEEVGALHTIANFNEVASTAPLMLGDVIDMENDGLPSASADGDDLDHSPAPYVNDEDAVQHIVAPPTPVDLSVPIVVTNNNSQPATLVGWIDTNADGSFFDEQRVVQNIEPNSGRGTYELTFPGLDLSGNTFARFRVFQGAITDDNVLQPAGFDSSFQVGEVEDHLVQVGSYGVQKTSEPTTGSTVTPGQKITYQLQITNTGSTDLIDLTVHDDLSDVLDDATLDGNPVVTPSSGGTATISDNTLQYDGDIPTGQSVTVSYTVTVKPADQLTNQYIRNLVIAAHSNCHPTIDDQTVTVDDPGCVTEHHIDAQLASTGMNMTLPLLAGGGLVVIGTVVAARKSRLFAKLRR